MPRFINLLGPVALALVCAMPPRAIAQSDPAAQALIDRLRPAATGSTRGIRLPTEQPVAMPNAPAIASPPPAPAAAAQSRPAAIAVVRSPTPAQQPAVPAVSITVNFPTGSAVLTPEATQALSPLGRAISSTDLAPYRFRIEGHTDTVGDAATNQILSDRRAAAVRDHLIQAYGVDPARLESRGFGFSQPRIATPPQTPEQRNRRVQVVNIGS